MPKTITQRDVTESITGLRSLVNDLRGTAKTETPNGAPAGTVLVDASALLRSAAYIESVADELLLLIPESKVTVPK